MIPLWKKLRNTLTDLQKAKGARLGMPLIAMSSFNLGFIINVKCEREYSNSSLITEKLFFTFF